jgi:hypothetical protein
MKKLLILAALATVGGIALIPSIRDMILGRSCKTCAYESTTPQSNVTPNNGANCEYALADLQIFDFKVIEQGDSLVLKAGITNFNDDSANEAKAEILLPAESKVISFSSDKSNVRLKQCRGYIVADLGNLQSNYKDSIAITVICEKAKAPCALKILNCSEQFSVFVHSTTPDSDHANNYKAWKRNCSAGTIFPDIKLPDLICGSSVSISGVSDAALSGLIDCDRVKKMFRDPCIYAKCIDALEFECEDYNKMKIRLIRYNPVTNQISPIEEATYKNGVISLPINREEFQGTNLKNTYIRFESMNIEKPMQVKMIHP